MSTSSEVVEQPEAVTVHLNVVVPTLKPVTPEVGLFGVVTVPVVPATRVHVPVPVGVTVLPAKVAVVVLHNV